MPLCRGTGRTGAELPPGRTGVELPPGRTGFELPLELNFSSATSSATERTPPLIGDLCSDCLLLAE